MAVGNFSDSSHYTQGLIETLAGGSPSVMTAPVPTAEANAGTDPRVSLDAVSCDSSTSCVAVGTYQDSSGEQGLIESLSGGTWSATAAPLGGLSDPGSAPGYQNMRLPAVSCPAAGSCVAVGNYDDASGLQQSLIETLSGGTWSATTAPLSNLSPAATGNPAIVFDALSCPASGSCVAIASYLDSSGGTDGLIETLSGGTWTATTAPLGGLTPGSASPPVVPLTALSCPATGSCVVIGDYDAASAQEGLIETQ